MLKFYNIYHYVSCHSLLRALMSEKKMTSGTEKEIPTDGIDIVPWTIASEDGTEVTYSTWDFAGQAVYYNTHQVIIFSQESDAPWYQRMEPFCV